MEDYVPFFYLIVLVWKRVLGVHHFFTYLWTCVSLYFGN
jgi:hypothetical protein